MFRSPLAILTVLATFTCLAACASTSKGPRVVLEGETVRLELPSDVHPERIESYQWVQTGGPEVTFNDASLPTPIFVAPNVSSSTELTFVLVTRSTAQKPVSRTVTLKLQADDDPPVADAGSPQTVNEGQRVRLYGIGTDPEMDELRFSWTQTDGPRVQLDDSHASSPSFVAPDVATNDYLNFRLVVSDARHSSPADDVTITVQGSNKLPVADAGADQAVRAGERITLVGSGHDPDGDNLSYQWSLVSKSPAVSLATPRSKELSFVTPACPEGQPGYELVLALTVDDGGGRSSPDEVVVAVRQSNRQPDASAGEPQTVGVGELVQLTGSGTDPDGDRLSYQWRSLSDEPSVLLSGDNTAEASFVAPPCPEGSFRYSLAFELVVSDGEAQSTPVQTLVAVAAANSAPAAAAGRDRTVTEGELVTLLGSGEDPEGGELNYRWRVLTPGAEIALTGADAQNASFEAPPCTDDAPYDLLFGLTVSDGQASSSIDELRITVRPEPRWGPLASGDELELFGSTVSDRLTDWTGDLSQLDSRRGYYADPETRGALGVTTASQAEIRRSLPLGKWATEGVLLPREAGSGARMGIRFEIGPDDSGTFGFVRSGEELTLHLYRSTEGPDGWSDPAEGERILEQGSLQIPIYFSVRWTGSSLRVKWSQKDDLDRKPERAINLPAAPRRIVLYGRDSIAAYRGLKLISNE